MSTPEEASPRRIAAYARVSTSQQTADLQICAIRDYARRRNWPEPEFFVDEGVSGSRQQRPSLDRLLAAARGRHIDVLIIWKLDRLGRSLGHLIELLEEYKQCGVDLVSVTESLDTTTPSGRALFGMLGVFAEFERSRIAYVGDSVTMDIAASSAAGLHPILLDPYDDHVGADFERIGSLERGSF